MIVEEQVTNVVQSSTTYYLPLIEDVEGGITKRFEEDILTLNYLLSTPPCSAIKDVVCGVGQKATFLGTEKTWLGRKKRDCGNDISLSTFFLFLFYTR